MPTSSFLSMFSSSFSGRQASRATGCKVNRPGHRLGAAFAKPEVNNSGLLGV